MVHSPPNFAPVVYGLVHPIVHCCIHRMGLSGSQSHRRRQLRWWWRLRYRLPRPSCVKFPSMPMRYLSRLLSTHSSLSRPSSLISSPSVRTCSDLHPTSDLAWDTLRTGRFLNGRNSTGKASMDQKENIVGNGGVMTCVSSPSARFLC